MARFHHECANCGLDFSQFNVGDGPAAFLTLCIGTLITILAVWLELGVGPPWWVHLILWLPLTTLAVIVGLRGAKAALLYAEWRRSAAEHRHRGG